MVSPTRPMVLPIAPQLRVLRLQLLHNRNRPLELHLVLLCRLYRTLAMATSLRSTIHPHEILRTEGDARVQAVDILRPRRRLGRNGG